MEPRWRAGRLARGEKHVPKTNGLQIIPLPVAARKKLDQVKC